MTRHFFLFSCQSDLKLFQWARPCSLLPILYLPLNPSFTSLPLLSFPIHTLSLSHSPPNSLDCFVFDVILLSVHTLTERFTSSVCLYSVIIWSWSNLYTWRDLVEVKQVVRSVLCALFLCHFSPTEAPQVEKLNNFLPLHSLASMFLFCTVAAKKRSGFVVHPIG